MKKALTDKTLSLKAKGLFGAICMSENDFLNLQDLSKLSKDGVDSTRSARDELVKNGYLKIENTRDRGKFRRSKWIINKEVSQ